MDMLRPELVTIILPALALESSNAPVVAAPSLRLLADASPVSLAGPFVEAGRKVKASELHSLDAPLNLGNAEDVLQTRSQLYRALTRAHMVAVVVNASVPGGWLEWLNTVQLKHNSVFDREAELTRLRADAVDEVIKQADLKQAAAERIRAELVKESEPELDDATKASR